MCYACDHCAVCGKENIKDQEDALKWRTLIETENPKLMKIVSDHIDNIIKQKDKE